MSDSNLQQLISERIQREGPIPFAEYMRMALYEPGYGYYMTGAAKMGWEADYFTSTDVSGLFANCMGRQLFAMWEKLKRPAHFIVLELGAGRGHLAEGVRRWAQKEAPEFYEVLDYRAEDIRGGQDAVEVEQGGGIGQPPRGRPRQGQPRQGQPALGRGKAPPLLYTNGIPIFHNDVEKAELKYSREDPRGRPVHPSVVVSNELVDAFPVHV
ncbi:MAG TPA: SAM-dependent methyltransferase, partial [Ktedonobacteraceae bacterium]